MNKLRAIYSSACSAIISIVVTTAVTVGMEFSWPPKAWLASFTGHHWVTKSWLSLIVFVLFFLIFWGLGKNISQEKVKKALAALNIVAILGFLVILLFFIFEFFKH